MLGQGVLNAWRAKEAAEIFEPAAVAFGDLVDDPALAAIEHQLARAYWFQEQNEEAIDLADRALGRAEQLEAAELIADVLITKGSLLAFAARPYEGAGALEAGIRLAESLGLTQIVVRGLLNLGVSYLGRDPRMSLDRSRAAHTLAGRFGLQNSYATALGNACEAAVMLGEWAWALTAMSEVSVDHLEAGDRATLLRPREDILAARGEPIDELLSEHERLIGDQDTQQYSNLLAATAGAAFAAGRYGEAADGWRRSSDLNMTNTANDLPQAARALLWAGDTDGVRSVLATFEAPSIHGRVVDLRRRTIRAALTALDGDRDAAAREYAAVLPELADLGLVYEQAQVVIDMVLVLGRDAAAVQGSVDDARAILARLGAAPLAARLEELLGQPARDGFAAAPERTTAEATASGTVQP